RGEGRQERVSRESAARLRKIPALPVTAVAGEMNPARAWLLAARPATLPAAAVPVFVGASAAVSEGSAFRALVFVATLLCALLIQIGTNFANDYSDFHRGA